MTSLLQVGKSVVGSPEFGTIVGFEETLTLPG
jgi:hypothetical protein